MCKHLFKTKAHPDSLTHLVTMGENPPPNMENTLSLLAKYQLATPKIWPIRTSDSPPWLCPVPKICPFTELKKIKRSNEEMRIEFLAHLELHPTKHVFTDGSKTEQYVGYAAKLQEEIISNRLPGEASIFTAELYAIRAALLKIQEDSADREKYTIFSDSQSCILSLKIRIKAPPLAEEIKNIIHRLEERNISIDFCWVPGHVGVRGNEEVDVAAKEAARRPNVGTETIAIPHTDMKRAIKEATRRVWQNEWVSGNHKGRKLREIKREVTEWSSSHNKSRKTETTLTRLRIGHTNATHAYLMQGHANPPECERCRRPITVKHIMVECRKFAAIRNKYYNNPTLSRMLGNDDKLGIPKLMSYLRETNLLSQI